MKSKEKAKKIIALDGVEIFYWTNYIKGSKKSFRILHAGSSLNHSSMEPLERELNNREYSTIIFDHRGTGYSVAPAIPGAYQIYKYAADLAKIIDVEGIESPVLIGHSMGFMPVVNYTFNYGNTESIVGISGSYHFPDTTASKPLFHLFNRVLRYNEFLGSALTNLFTHQTTGIPRTYTDQSRENVSGWEMYLSIVDVPFSEVKSHIVSGKEINKWNIRTQLERINTPVLLLYGAKDKAVLPSTGIEIEKMMQSPCISIELPKLSHNLHIEDSKKTVNVMEEYQHRSSI